jgi:hypothetical protein
MKPSRCRIKLPDHVVTLAENIIDRMTGELEPDKFENRYAQAMIALIRSRQAGQPAPKEEATTRPAKVVNRMDALRCSIGETTGKKTPTKKAEPTAKPRRRPLKDKPALQVRDGVARTAGARNTRKHAMNQGSKEVSTDGSFFSGRDKTRTFAILQPAGNRAINEAG